MSENLRSNVVIRTVTRKGERFHVFACAEGHNFMRPVARGVKPFRCPKHAAAHAKAKATRAPAKAPVKATATATKGKAKADAVTASKAKRETARKARVSAAASAATAPKVTAKVDAQPSLFDADQSAPSLSRSERKAARRALAADLRAKGITPNGEAWVKACREAGIYAAA